MPIYIIHADAGLTDEYHSGGKAIVTADSLDEAVLKIEAQFPGVVFSKFKPDAPVTATEYTG